MPREGSENALFMFSCQPVCTSGCVGVRFVTQE